MFEKRNRCEGSCCEKQTFMECGPAHTCGGNASCVAACGSAAQCSSVRCQCNPGFRGDGYVCHDLGHDAEDMHPAAPECFTAEYVTSAGNFTIEARRRWSPHGVNRLYSLLQAGYYDDTRIYRVVPGWVAQFGYSGDPMLQSAATIIPDEPVREGTSNLRGVISYSAAYEASQQHATNRTTELYINLADHAQLDALGFAPVARVVRGMAAVESFFSGYGELSDACDLHGFTPCKGPSENRILNEGNAYLDIEFPLLTRIFSASVIGTCAGDARSSARQASLTLSVTAIVCVAALLVFMCSKSTRVQLRKQVLRLCSWADEVCVASRAVGQLRGMLRGRHSTSSTAGATLELRCHDSAQAQAAPDCAAAQ
jgi:peptidyl-prolyl cis-trans isomerase A (cyclophilin A)